MTEGVFFFFAVSPDSDQEDSVSPFFQVYFVHDVP